MISSSAAEVARMSEPVATSPATVPTTAPRSTDTAAGWSVLLAALASGFALGAIWVINSTYERYRGRTDLDMPDWLVINMDLTSKVVPLAGASGLCLLVAGGLFLSWAGKAGWAMRAGFIVQWLVSAIIVGLVVFSRLPHSP
jgi:hypothetical protein